MSEIKLIYGDLRLTIREPKMVGELEKLDRNKDGYVHYSDFDGDSQTQKEARLLDKVQTVFIPAEDNQGSDTFDHETLRRFFILYNKITGLWKAASFWYSKRTSISGGEVEFRLKDWAKIYPQITGDGEYTPEKVTAMTYELRKVLIRMTTEITVTDNNRRITSNCGGHVKGFTYNAVAVSPQFQEEVRRMVLMYREIENFFDFPDEGATDGRFPNKEMECDEGWFGERCPGEDEVEFKPAFLDPVVAGMSTTDILTGACGSGGYCFSPDTLLKTKTGTISFRELAVLKAAGRPLPEIASWDEAKGEEVYQRPTLLIEHPQIESALIYLNVQGSSKPLEVTPEHRMLVSRNGEQKWIQAGSLKSGDRLIGPGADQNFIDLAATRTLEGVFTVYNLSFSSAQTGMHPTYLVSPDGAHWYAAHNIK